MVTINDGDSSRSGTITVNGVTHRVTQVPFLVKPTLLAPPDSDTFYFDRKITFSWKEVQGATRYYIAIRYSGTVTNIGLNFNRDAYVENSTSHTLVLNYNELVNEGVVNPLECHFIWAVYALNEYESELIPELKSEIREFSVYYPIL